MSETIEKYTKLVDRLFEFTKDKRIEWRSDPFTDEVSCHFSNFNIKINDGSDSEGSPYIKLSIVNFSDVEIDSFTDNDLVSNTPKLRGYSSYWKLMEELLKLARRQSRGADDAIDNILNELDAKDQW